jgi:hypothetical protein
MKHAPPTWVKILLIVVFFSLLVGLLAIGLHGIFIKSTPGIDLYIFWVAGRSLFLNGQNPYSLEVTQAIQLGIYGHLLEPGKDPMRFAYPPYALVSLWPLVWMTFDWVQAIWFSFNLLVLAIFLRIALPRLPIWSLLCVYLIYPFSFGLILGNFAILIGAILILCLARLMLTDRNPNRLEQIALGVLLAWTTAKPQFVWFFIVVLIVNGLRKKQYHFLAGFLGGGIGLLATSFILLPNWPVLWLNRMIEYARDDPAISPLKFYLGAFFPLQWMDGLIPIVWATILGVSAWLMVLWIQKKLDLNALLSWGGAAIFLITPNGRGYEQIPFFIPLFLWVDQLCIHNKKIGLVLPILAILTWGLFGLSRGTLSQAADRWAFLLYLPWVAWVVFQPRARSVTV